MPPKSRRSAFTCCTVVPSVQLFASAIRRVRTFPMSVGIDAELHSGWELLIVDEDDEPATDPHPMRGQQ